MKTFKDAKGRIWSPRITTLVMDRYEQVTGKSLLEAVYGFVEQMLEGKAPDEMKDAAAGKQIKVPVKKVVEFFRGMFGHFGDIPRLLFESIRWNQDGSCTDVTYEDFANALPGECMEDAMLALYEALADFFQKALGAKVATLGASLIKAVAPGAEKTSSD